jgi:hypothetical protein
MAAPHVSIVYWQDITKKYSDYTLQKNTSDKIFSALLTNQSQPIFNLLMDNGEYEHAKLVWLTRYGLAKRSEGVNTSYPLTKEIITDIETKMENLNPNDELYKLTFAIAKEKLQQGQVIQAASAYLSIKDYFNTFKILVRTNELEIAYMLMKIIKYDFYENDILMGLALKSLRSGRIDTYYLIFEKISCDETKVILYNIYSKGITDKLKENVLKCESFELLHAITIGDTYKACNLFNEHFDEFAESIIKGSLNLDNYRKILKTNSHMRVINFNQIDK